MTPGTDALDALYLNDQIMEFDLTPNRADALSMVGTAYEVAALYQAEMTKPNTTLNETETSETDELSVTVDNPEKSLITVQELLKCENCTITYLDASTFN